MNSVRRRRMGIALVAFLSVALVAGVGIYLARTTAAARTTVLGEFTQRVRSAADTAASTLVAGDERNREAGMQQFAGTEADLERARKAKVGEALGVAWWLILDPAGRPLGSDSDATRATAPTYVANPGFAVAQRTGRQAPPRT